MNGVNIYKCPNISKKTVKSKPEVEWIQTWKPLLSSQMLAWIIVFAPRFREDEMGSILPLSLSHPFCRIRRRGRQRASQGFTSRKREITKDALHREMESFSTTPNTSLVLIHNMKRSSMLWRLLNCCSTINSVSFLLSLWVLFFEIEFDLFLVTDS